MPKFALWCVLLTCLASVTTWAEPEPTAPPDLNIWGLWPVEGTSLPPGAEVWFQSSATNVYVYADGDPDNTERVGPLGDDVVRGWGRLQIPAAVPEGVVHVLFDNGYEQIDVTYAVQARAVDGGLPSVSVGDMRVAVATNAFYVVVSGSVSPPYSDDALAYHLQGVDDEVSTADTTGRFLNPAFEGDVDVETWSQTTFRLVEDTDETEVCLRLSGYFIDGEWRDGETSCSTLSLTEADWSAMRKEQAFRIQNSVYEQMVDASWRAKDIGSGGCGQTPASTWWALLGGLLVLGRRRRRQP